MEVEFVVVDERRKVVSIGEHSNFDVNYYRRILDRAWNEIKYGLSCSAKHSQLQCKQAQRKY